MSKDIGNLYAELSGIKPAGDRSATETRMRHLQQQIADEAAQTEIVEICKWTREGEGLWCVLPDGLEGELMDRALEYLHLRNLIEYDSTGKLVRFVEAS